MNYLYVFIGGFFGSIARYLVGITIQPFSSGFPIQTLLINLIGCFFLGFFLPFAKKRLKPEYSLLIGTGFTGGFTTFSTFSLENVKLMNQNQMITSTSYIFTSIVFGISLSFLGYKVAEKFLQVKGERDS